MGRAGETAGHTQRTGIYHQHVAAPYVLSLELLSHLCRLQAGNKIISKNLKGDQGLDVMMKGQCVTSAVYVAFIDYRQGLGVMMKGQCVQTHTAGRLVAAAVAPSSSSSSSSSSLQRPTPAAAAASAAAAAQFDSSRPGAYQSRPQVLSGAHAGPTGIWASSADLAADGIYDEDYDDEDEEEDDDGEDGEDDGGEDDTLGAAEFGVEYDSADGEVEMPEEGAPYLFARRTSEMFGNEHLVVPM